MKRIPHILLFTALTLGSAGCQQQEKETEVISRNIPASRLDSTIQSIEAYNVMSLEDQKQYWQEISDGRMMLIPFSYDYPWKDSEIVDGYNVGIEGRLGIEHMEKDEGFDLYNYDPRWIWVDREEGGMERNIPEDHSVLKIYEGTDPENMQEMFDIFVEYTTTIDGKVNQAFEGVAAEKFMPLGVDKRDLNALKTALNDMGYDVK